MKRSILFGIIQDTVLSNSEVHRIPALPAGTAVVELIHIKPHARCNHGISYDISLVDNLMNGTAQKETIPICLRRFG